MQRRCLQEAGGPGSLISRGSALFSIMSHGSLLSASNYLILASALSLSDKLKTIECPYHKRKDKGLPGVGGTLEKPSFCGALVTDTEGIALSSY